MNTNVIQKDYNITEVGDTDNTLKNTIDTYLEDIKKLKSVNTYINYLGWYKDFFKKVFGKEMQFCTWKDISNKELLNINSIKKYRLYLQEEKKNNGATINNKLSAIRTLFEELNNMDIESINVKAFNIDRLSEEDSETYDTLSEEEINMLFDYCKNKETNGLIKYLYFKMLYITAFRKNSTRNIKWSDIKKQRDSETNIMVWTVTVKDKGNRKLVKAISDEFYNELLSLKYKNTKQDDYVFSVVDNTPISKNTIDKVFDNYRREYGLDTKDRNIVIHSIKHSSATKAYEISGHDIKATQIQANHRKSSTTMDSYVNKKISFTNQISYIIDKKIDKTTLDSLSQEQLLEIIKSANDSIFLELQRQAKLKGYIK